MGDVVVIGAAGMEYVITAPALAREGETVLASGHVRIPGGTGANRAVAAARMGAPTSLIAALGDDEDGAEVLRFLRSEGLDTAGVELHAHALTGLAITFSIGGRRAATTLVPGPKGVLTADQVARALGRASEGSLVVLQWDPRAPESIKAVRAASGTRHRVLLVADSLDGIPLEVLEHIAVLVTTESVGTVAGGPTTTPPILNLPELHDTFNPQDAPSGDDADERDVHGRRFIIDAFVGALAAELALGQSFEDSQQHAVRAALFVSSRPGSESPFPTRARLQQTLADNVR